MAVSVWRPARGDGDENHGSPVKRMIAPRRPRAEQTARRTNCDLTDLSDNSIQFSSQWQDSMA
jgi:hypothetical protein